VCTLAPLASGFLTNGRSSAPSERTSTELRRWRAGSAIPGLVLSGVVGEGRRKVWVAGLGVL